MTDHDDAPRRRSTRLRAGLAAVAVTTALLPAVWGGSPAGAALAPDGAVAAGGYLYWSNTVGRISKPGNGMIGRASLNGTHVDQKFITGASLPGMVLVYRGYLYWGNIVPLGDGDGMIGRANLNGTGVNQNFIAVPHGPSGDAGVAVNSRYIYWTDEKGNEIGRANLNGTDVNQKFITGAHFPDAIAAGPQYLYWTNQNSHAIGRARLNGTDVNQRFLARKDFLNLHGIAVDPGR